MSLPSIYIDKYMYMIIWKEEAHCLILIHSYIIIGTSKDMARGNLSIYYTRRAILKADGREFTERYVARTRHAKSRNI